jgi:hypothetical protein
MNIGHFTHPHPPIPVLHVHQVFSLPVQIIREVGYLLLDLVEGVA